MSNRILVLHGPNLNLLGDRPQGIYGDHDLEFINNQIISLAKSLGLEVDIDQSNHEGVILDQIQKASGRYRGIIINPGALTHTSLALRDAVEAIATPVVEVHLSDILARDEIRRRSLLAGVVAGRISGFGWVGYLLAVRYLADFPPAD